MMKGKEIRAYMKWLECWPFQTFLTELNTTWRLNLKHRNSRISYVWPKWPRGTKCNWTWKSAMKIMLTIYIGITLPQTSTHPSSFSRWGQWLHDWALEEIKREGWNVVFYGGFIFYGSSLVLFDFDWGNLHLGPTSPCLHFSTTHCRFSKQSRTKLVHNPVIAL